MEVFKVWPAQLLRSSPMQGLWGSQAKEPAACAQHLGWGPEGLRAKEHWWLATARGHGNKQAGDCDSVSTSRAGQASSTRGQDAGRKVA
eukprot:849622-Karenia_brevis.AAC.1